MLQKQSNLPEAFMSWPDIHGSKVVFTAEGDLWIGDTSTLTAKRLTSDVGTEDHARFSPDGKQIYFSGNYDGTNALYRISVDGGAPEQLTYDVVPSRSLMDFSPDGKKGLVSYPTNNPFTSTLGWLDLKTKVVDPLPFEMASFSAVNPETGHIALTRVAQTWQNWFGYQGGQVNPIWYGDPKTMKFKRVYASKGSNEYPAISGDRIYFCQDDNGFFYIRSVKFDGSALKTVAGPYDVQLQQLHSYGTKLVYMKGAGLESIDLSTGKITELNFHLESDQPKSRPFYAPAESWVQNMSLAPDGNRVLVESRGQIVSVPVKDGAARIVLHKPGVRYRWASYSPDKKQLAYISDETGEEQLYVANADGSNPVAWTKSGERNFVYVKWSPDSKLIGISDDSYQITLIDAVKASKVEVNRFAFSKVPVFSFSPDSKWLVTDSQNPQTGFSSIVLYNIEKKQAYPIALGNLEAKMPAFSTDGKFISFINSQVVAPDWDPIINQMNSNGKSTVFLLALSKDTKSPFLTKSDDTEEKPSAEEKKPEAPKDTKIDVEGLESRLISVPLPEDLYSEAIVAGDRIIAPTDKELKYFDIKTKKGGSFGPISPMWVVPEWESRVFELSPDASKLLIIDSKPRVIATNESAVTPDSGKVNFGGIRIEVDPKSEWNQMFNESWRYIRTYFYDPNMHGINWPAIKDKYAPYVRLVRNRTDLTYIIKWLESEVNTGHMYNGGGDTRSTYRPQTAAYLGIDTKPDQGFLKITNILKGDHFSKASPFAQVGLGVSVGDYILSIAGVDVSTTSDPYQGIRGRAGKTVEIVVNTKPTREGAKTIVVQPIESERELRTQDWTDRQREYVKKKSGGKIGYIHLAAMGNEDFADFIKQYYAQDHLEGMIIDIRYNGGGNLAGPITEILARTVKMWGYLRTAGDYKGRDSDAFLGHLACMVNEHSYSEGEGFPYYFRAAKLGPIIGKRTWGGYVGSWPGWPLVDGSSVSVSHYGGWNPKEGWVIEGTGVIPDIEVENDPAAFAAGNDMQLDKAIEVLLKQIKEKPVVYPTRPAFPNKALRGEGKKE